MIKKNIKVIVAFILGIIVSGTAVYATGTILFQSSQVSFDNTRAGLKNAHGDDVTTVEEAIETLVNGSCSSSPFKVGDYINMTPTSQSFTPDRTITGLDDYDTHQGNPAGTTTVAGTLNPSELTVWRVIKLNPNCTVEMVSENVSSVNVKFASEVGYQNLIYYLNEVAKQYANTTYTLNPSTAPDGAFRNTGYDGQMKQITDKTRLDDTTVGASGGAWYIRDNFEENLGGGDTKFGTDLKLLSDAGVSMRAVTPNTTNITAYWLSSRFYFWNNASHWYFNGRFMDSNGSISYNSLWGCYSGSLYSVSNSYAVRPIVTLKSNVTHSSGSGISSSHYTLSVS